MVASGVSQQPRWVPHVTGSPWLITIIKWRDLREESFPSQARQWPHVIHHSHHHQPPASDSSNQSNWRQDKRERETMLVASSSGLMRLLYTGHYQCESCHHTAPRHSILTRLPSLCLGLCSRSSSLAQPNWDRVRGARQSTLGWCMMIRAGDKTGAAGNTNTSYYTISRITNYPNPNKVSLSLVSSLHSQVDLYIEVTLTFNTQNKYLCNSSWSLVK